MQPSRSRTTATVPVSHVQAREKEDTKSCRKAVSISAKCSPAADLILPFRCFQRPEREEIGVYSCYRAVFIRPTERKVPEAGKCKAGTTIFFIRVDLPPKQRPRRTTTLSPDSRSSCQNSSTVEKKKKAVAAFANIFTLLVRNCASSQQKGGWIGPVLNKPSWLWLAPFSRVSKDRATTYHKEALGH